MTPSIPWRDIKALSFDIYGTLIDWEKGLTQAARNSALGPFLPADHKTLVVDITKYETAMQQEFPTMKQSLAITHAIERYAAELQVVENGHLSAEELERAAQEIGSSIGRYPAFNDTIQAMELLAKHYKVIVLSNVDHESFSQTLIGPLQNLPFDAVYIAEDIGTYKPNLNNFRYLVGHLKENFGIEQDELCHVANSLFHDQEPAKEFGLPYRVWVDRRGFAGGEAEGAEERLGMQVRVETLGELAEIVEGAWREG
ncbi:hypothetical protein CKM354_000204400 [Cercospora kikuchii]|uniref:Hydrolase n=1 Tax=Cercospora kikuchii TaxID=84275 RepID=A0A9P3CC29_9PEZI|nr:uncharacterized protein CKM354_000204400 [Cercospora kikuchii]GIZ38632.1 hypothetical protein CKM354_000204400 [Cercospora kikuchii]